jgi:hypothetical protein
MACNTDTPVIIAENVIPSESKQIKVLNLKQCRQNLVQRVGKCMHKHNNSDTSIMLLPLIFQLMTGNFETLFKQGKEAASINDSSCQRKSALWIR